MPATGARPTIGHSGASGFSNSTAESHASDACPKAGPGVGFGAGADAARALSALRSTRQPVRKRFHNPKA
jgi:hypothetical protein